MIKRAIADFARKNADWFPVISVTGPRQSGKSTLVQNLFAEYDYENLELPGTLQAAKGDPLGFVSERPHKLIIDEAQLAPQLFNVIQVESDRMGVPGQYVLSGSQNFLLHERITQSLAGRVGIVHLLPLSYAELVSDASWAGFGSDDFALRGGYPRLYDVDIPADVYFRNYVNTYIERDVAGFIDARNKQAFRVFVALCAQSCGNLLNITRLAADAGISTKTARSWLSILESSFIVFRLLPHHANVRKQLTKTPKLYFYDTGLLCHLLGLSDAASLAESPYAGAVFENYVISEELKRRFNGLKRPQVYFYRDDSKIEIDMIDVTDAARPLLCEMKSGRTYRPSFARSLVPVSESLDFKDSDLHVVYGGEGSFADGAVHVDGITEWLLRE